MHEFVYIAGARLRRNRRNALTGVVLASSCLLAYGGLIPHARFWRGLYSSDSRARSPALQSPAVRDTDAQTARWVREQPDSVAIPAAARAQALHGDQGADGGSPRGVRVLLQMEESGDLPAGLGDRIREGL